MKNIRFKAEWEHSCATLLALPHYDTDWAPILEEAHDQYRRLTGALLGAGLTVYLLVPDLDYGKRAMASVVSDRLIMIAMDYNDTWTRDYGPIAIESDGALRALDFGFNGWGLKFASDKDNLVNLNLCRKQLIPIEFYRNNRNFELEGGSVDTDGMGTLLTTSRCLCSPNRNGGRSKHELNEILSSRLGTDHILWLDFGWLAGDDTDSHIDTLARMAPGNTILFTGCRNIDDEHFEELLRMRAQLTMFRTQDGDPYNLVELPLPDAVFDPEGNRLPATYANYLVTDTHIFMPTYAQPANDTLAAHTLKVAFPDHEVVCVDCRTLLRQHGSLHCATMQIYPGEML